MAEVPGVRPAEAAADANIFRHQFKA